MSRLATQLFPVSFFRQSVRSALANASFPVVPTQELLLSFKPTCHFLEINHFSKADKAPEKQYLHWKLNSVCRLLLSEVFAET